MVGSAKSPHHAHVLALASARLPSSNGLAIVRESHVRSTLHRHHVHRPVSAPISQTTLSKALCTDCPSIRPPSLFHASVSSLSPTCPDPSSPGCLATSALTRPPPRRRHHSLSLPASAFGNCADSPHHAAKPPSESTLHHTSRSPFPLPSVSSRLQLLRCSSAPLPLDRHLSPDYPRVALSVALYHEPCILSPNDPDPRATEPQLDRSC